MTGGSGILHGAFLGKSALRVERDRGGVHSLTLSPVVLPKSTGSSAWQVTSSWVSQLLAWLGGGLPPARLAAAPLPPQLMTGALALLVCAPELITT